MNQEIRLSVIGAGNMASAIVSGIMEKKLMPEQNLGVYDIDPGKSSLLSAKYHITAFSTIEEAFQGGTMILLAVKPHIVPNVLKQLSMPNKAIVSIAAGVSYEKIKQNLRVPARLLRIMPNTPLLVGEGCSVFAAPTTLNAEEFTFISNIFSNLGTVCQVEERLIHAVTGVSGSGPAYVYLFIETLADAGVRHGLSRETALALAAQTVLGSAKMVEATKQHPAVLKDAVCSPGGTTIDAVAALEENGFRGALLKAVDACVEKSKNL